MRLTKFKTEEYGGVDVTVSIGDNGRFYAEFPAFEGVEAVHDSTLEGLTTKAKRKAAQLKARKPVEITIFGLPAAGRQGLAEFGSYGDDDAEGPGLLHCTLRGVHGRTDALLVTIDGKNTQIDNWSYKQNICRRFTPEECQDYERLALAATAAKQALVEWIDARRIAVNEAGE